MADEKTKTGDNTDDTKTGDAGSGTEKSALSESDWSRLTDYIDNRITDLAPKLSSGTGSSAGKTTTRTSVAADLGAEIRAELAKLKDDETKASKEKEQADTIEALKNEVKQIKEQPPQKVSTLSKIMWGG